MLILDLALDAAVAKVMSSSVGGISALQSGAGKNRWRSCRAAERLSFGAQAARYSRVRTSSALPSRMNPGSEYSARVPGSALKGQLQAGAKQRGGSGDGAEQLDIAGQPRIMGQQMTQLYWRAARAGERPTTKPGSNSPRGVSRSNCPRWLSSMAAAVVAATLVTLAMS